MCVCICLGACVSLCVCAPVCSLMDILSRQGLSRLLFCFHSLNPTQDNRENLSNLKSMDHHYLDEFGLFDVLIKQQEGIYLARESELLRMVSHFD